MIKQLDLGAMGSAFAAVAEAKGWATLHTPDNLAKAISVEAAELLEVFQWESRSLAAQRADSELCRQAADEIADILLYINALANTLAIDIPQAVEHKIRVNQQRYGCD